MKRIISLLLVCTMLTLCFTACQSDSDAAPEVELVQVVKMKTDVKKGEMLSVDNVELVKVNAANLPSNICKNMDEVVSKYAASDLYAGDALDGSKLSDKPSESTLAEALNKFVSVNRDAFVVVSDYIKPNAGVDVYGYLQSLINQNPGRTIYFPDGEYIISQSLTTSSEGPKSTTFFLSDNAVLKASDNWKNTENGANKNKALICLGQLKADGTHVNDSGSNGSYFGVFGGTLDGNNKAQGVCIASSRESVVYGASIKNATVGISIEWGANGGPSDADVENVEIIGNGLEGSVGISIGHDRATTDNTFTNIKIYNMETGVFARGGGNAFRNVDVYFSEYYENYDNTKGYNVSTNFLYDCYVENACNAFYLVDSWGYMLDGLSAGWTYDAKFQTAFCFTGGFSSRMSHCRADFYDDSTYNEFITNTYGSGKIDSPILDTTLEKGGYYKKFLTSNSVVDLSKAN